MIDRVGLVTEEAARDTLVRRIAWALLLAIPLLWQLGGSPLFDVDEGAFSEATREMLASGDWWHTTLNGVDRFDKPIGVYWLQALSAAAFGVNEFAFRLPSALSAWVMALALSAFAARRWGQPAGWIAGLVTVTSVGVQLIGRSATADGLLNVLLVLTGLDLWRHIESGERAPLRRAFAWVGFGLLVKGPVAVLVPGAAILVWCATSRRWSVLWRAARDVPGWLLLLAIAVPWYAYALHRHGMAFVEGFLLHHNVERFTGTVGGHRGTVFYYVVILPLLAMPWAPLLFKVVGRARSAWSDPLARYLLGWSAFVILFFSFGGTKLPHYALYGYAPLVLLMARALAQGSRRLVAIQSAMVVAWSAVAVALPFLVLHFAPTVKDPLYRDLLSGAPAPSWLPGAVLVATLLAVVVWARRSEAPWRAPAAAAVLLSIYIAAFALPWFGEALQGPIRRAAAIAAAQRGPVVQWQVHWPTFAVYFGQPVPRRTGEPPAPQEVVLTRRDRMNGIDAGRPRLLDERGVVLLGPKAP